MAIRRWRVWSIVLAAAILPQALVHAAAPTAKDFEAMDQKDMPGKVLEILHDLPSLVIDPVGRDKAASPIGKDFTAEGQGVNSTRPEVRLNSAI